MEAYFEGVLALGRRVLQLLALALDLPPTWFHRTPQSCAEIGQFAGSVFARVSKHHL